MKSGGSDTGETGKVSAELDMITRWLTRQRREQGKKSDTNCVVGLTGTICIQYEKVMRRVSEGYRRVE